MSFYTHFELDWDHLLLSYYEDGKKKHRKVKLKPYLFIPSALEDAGYKTIDEKSVMRVDFDSVKEARNFVKSYEDVANFKVYGSPLYHYVYIYENFKQQKVDRSLLKVLNYDIEVDTTEGYPTHNMADREINAITMKIFGSKDVYVLGMWDYNPDNPEPEMQKLIKAGFKFRYKKCKNEEELIRMFFNIWEKLNPDVVTGWNIKFFDIPYIIKRAVYLFGDDFAKKLSPFGKIKFDTVTLFNKENDVFDIVGVPTLDYMDIYKKFSMGVEESYSLNYLSTKLLDASKLDYSEWGSLAKLQAGDPVKYMNYNVIDVIRVEQIDDKVKYMDIAFEIAYETLTNYGDSMTTIRVWDAMIHNYLMDRNIVVPNSSENRKDRTIAGGHVKDPQVGKHKWVMSFDFKSLYPHLCMTFNISPDTYLGTLKDIVGVTSVEKIMNGELDKHNDIIVRQNVTVTGAGTVFSRKKQGFIPAIMEHLFNLRSVYSAKEDEYTKLYAGGDKAAELQAGIFANKSYAVKILLNSGYGALSNEFYRFFHNLIAESFTLSGQLAIRTVADYVNKKVNELLGTTDVDYIIAIDTDSFYLNMEEIVNRYCGDQDPVDFLEKYSDIVQEWIKEGLTGLYNRTNAFEKKLFMSLEAIGPAIWIAKKRYVMSLPSFKKVRFNPPKIKIMGIEAVRSTTPLVARKWITEAIPLALEGQDNTIKEYIDKKWEEFCSLPFDDIAMPKGTNDLEKYMDRTSIYAKATPFHVRGALLFNDYVRKNGWERDIDLIKSGDKVKSMYLKVPNPLMENAISTPESLPGIMKEFSEYIDLEKQFDKTFLDALRRITNAAGINLNSNIGMDDFYG